MSRQRSSGKKGPVDPPAPVQQPLQSPPGRLSMAQLKKQAAMTPKPQDTTNIPPPQQALPPSTPTLGKNTTGGIAGMVVPKTRVNEDGRVVQIDNMRAKSSSSKVSTQTQLKSNQIQRDLEPLPLFTHPNTIPLKFEKFLKIEKTSTIAGTIFNYPLIGISQPDAARLGLIMNDLVVLSVIDPTNLSLDPKDFISDQEHQEHREHQEHQAQQTSPISTPFQSPIKSSQFKHQNPSLLSTPILNKSSSQTPNTPGVRPNNPSSTALPAGTHHHLAICRVQTFAPIERGSFRIDTQLKSMLQWFPLYKMNIIREIYKSTGNDEFFSATKLFQNFQNEIIIQQFFGSNVKREELDRKFFSDLFPYITVIKESNNFITNTNTQQGNMYPTTLITPISSVSIAKNNITMSDHDELSIIISRQTQSLLTPSTSQSTLTSIPQQLSKAVDIALSCSLTRIQSQTTFILPHSPFCASVCGTLRPYYPYQFINSNGAHITPSEDNVIQIFSTTPQTKVSITLGKREEEGMIKRGEKIQKSQIKLDKNNTTDQDPCPIEPLSFPATPTHPNPQNPQNSLVDKSSSIPIAGLDQEMRILKETLELPLKQPELFSTFGLKPPKGVLLHGPPGCGKTLLAHWFSNYTSAQFIPLTATNIISRGGANYLYSLFNSLSSSSSSTAPSQSNSGSIPIILFIDEIDGLCSDNTVVCALLSLLDGGHDRFSNICILAATNRPNVLPPALRRPGRFDVELNITPPSIQARDDILRVKLEKKNILHELTRTEISSIADHANGFVGADIDLLISEAISHSVLTMYRKQEERNESKKFIEIDSSITQASKLTLADFSYALQVVRPSGLRDYSSISITDSQVGGHEEIKQRLEEAFEWPLRHANLVDMLGARKSSGILLFGPPGCAKTLLAKSICARSKRTFLSVKGPELFSKYVGDSEKAVRAVFQRARACAPCILFLDEVDSFGGARGGSGGGGGGGDATDRVVSQLLVELDGISDRGDVCILAATNRPDMVDRALLRAGRLDRSLYVGPPDLNETEQILNINFKQMSCEDDVFLQMKQVAKMCFEKRHTGAELAAICRDASVRALTRYITQQEVKMKVMESNLGNLDQEHFAKLLAEFESDGEENDENDENKPLTTKSADEKDVYVTLADVFGAVNEAVPRITPNMIQFYLDYQLKHGLTNL